MKKVVKIIVIVVAVLAMLAMLIAVVCQDNEGMVSNEDAKADSHGRYLMIQNETEKTINEVHVMDSTGSEIDSMSLTNPDDLTYALEIPSQYSNESTFTVVFVDVRGKEYSKTVSGVGKKDHIPVTISKSDKVKKGLFD